MEQRNIVRFRKRVILFHWLQATSFIVLLISGFIMLLDVTSITGGQLLRTIHLSAAAFLVIVPVLFIILEPKAAIKFLKETFYWDHDNLLWLKSSISFYFGRKKDMPPQGYLNGDQKLWQLIILISGIIFALTGIMMWFFQLKMPLIVYQAILITHIIAFFSVLCFFIIHVYLTTLSPKFDGSLSSMVDGNISDSYAREHFGKWYKEISKDNN